MPASHFPEPAAAFISALLERDPETRLGAAGAREIRLHPYFADIDWSALEAHQLGRGAPLINGQSLTPRGLDKAKKISIGFHSAGSTTPRGSEMAVSLGSGGSGIEPINDRTGRPACEPRHDQQWIDWTMLNATILERSLVRCLDRIAGKALQAYSTRGHSRAQIPLLFQREQEPVPKPPAQCSESSTGIGRSHRASPELSDASTTAGSHNGSTPRRQSARRSKPEIVLTKDGCVSINGMRSLPPVLRPQGPASHSGSPRPQDAGDDARRRKAARWNDLRTREMQRGVTAEPDGNVVLGAGTVPVSAHSRRACCVIM